jgi:rhodanese-related sulfurtransferase
MNVAAISPQKLLEISRRGTAIDLVDVRTRAEYREAHVQFARNVPLDRLKPESLMLEIDGSPSRPLYIVCRSGSRGRQACEKFLKAGFSNVINVEGGTLACEQAGFTIVRGAKTISLERQVRIAAGSLVLLGAVLAWFVHPAFIALSAFVGAGLTFSGVTDTCGMGMLLARMPWNRAEPLPECATPLRATHTGHTQPCD